jgi:hypothetical protein
MCERFWKINFLKVFLEMQNMHELGKCMASY